MKYLRILLILCVIFSLSSCHQESEKTQVTDYSSLSEIQTVWSQQSELQENLKQERIITQPQKELFEISQIFQTHAEKYNQTITDILKKYKNNFTQSDVESLKLLLSTNYSNEVLQQKLENLLQTEILKSDVQKLKESYLKFIDEKNVQIQRLKIQQDEQTMMSITQRDKIITTLVGDIISSKEDWSEQEIQNIMQEIITYFYQNNSISDIESFTDIIQTLEETYNTVINTENIINSSYDFDELSFLDFMQNLTQNYETTLSYNELVEYYNSYTTHSLLLENITTEISLIESDTPLTQYETILEENTTQIESLYETHEVFTTLTLEEIESYFTSELDYSEIEVLHQERIQEIGDLPDAVTQSLQQEYKDDSAMLETLSPIAYVQELSGYDVLITNLAGGSKLAEENDLLYAGYTIESFSDSQTVLVFSDESLLRIEENSKLILTQSTNSNLGVDIEYGNIWSRVIKPLFTQDSFEISSDSVSLAVRGTSVYIQKARNSDSLSAYIVDSYTAKGTNSVELRDNATNESLSLGKGEVFSKIKSDISGQKSTFTKVSLMQQDDKVSHYLKDDLQYLSLTLDDRNRGFYNNPISEKNDSKNFIDKLTGELESSLPTTQELNTLFENSQTPKNNITSDTIYLRIMQDRLISDIKNNSRDNTPAKISAVASLDIEKLSNEVGNLREIENRLDLNISDEIISKPSLNSQEITDIFSDFGLEQQQANKNKLLRVKKYLQDTINNGSAYVSSNLQLPTEHEGVNINWISNNSEYLNDAGEILKRSTQKDIILSLTAYMSIESQQLNHVFPLIIKKKKPTDQQKLEKAYYVLLEYINRRDMYTDSILIPNFNEQGAIIPKIVWKQDEVVLSNGGLIRPSFVEGDIINYPAIATLSFGEAVLKNKEFKLKRIKKQPEIPEAVQNTFDVWSAQTIFPDCNLHDIELSNGQVWAMCNVEKKKDFDGARAACNTGYKTPTRQDWLSAYKHFSDTYTDMKDVMQLGNESEYWTSDKKCKIGTNCAYTFEKGNIGTAKTRSNGSFLPVRCIKDDGTGSFPGIIYPSVPTPIPNPAPTHTGSTLTHTGTAVTPNTTLTNQEIAEQEILDMKNTFERYFSDTVTIPNTTNHITDISGFPIVSDNITLEWLRAPRLLGQHGTVHTPSYNRGIQTRDILLQISYSDTAVTNMREELSVSLIFNPAVCSGIVIDDECYELVASAEYNENYKLGNLNPTNTSNRPNIVTNNGEKGVKPLSSRGHELSYDLSSLNLGDDWAIEMSVRGEDLRLRSTGDTNTYYLFSSPEKFSIYTWNNEIRFKKNGESSKIYNSSSITNGYHDITITKSDLYINGNSVISYSNALLNNIIKVGSTKNNTYQLNSIINSFKVYKKN